MPGEVVLHRVAGRPNRVALRLPGGERREFAKATRLSVPRGATLELMCGGGYGPPIERDRGAVLDDVGEGYISEAHARAHYPHAFADLSAPPAERDPAAVLSDLREGYISEAHAREHYGHAFARPGARPAAA